MEASWNNNYEIAKYCLEHGAKVDLKTKDGMTALILAVAENHKEVASLLLEYDADTTIVDEVKLLIILKINYVCNSYFPPYSSMKQPNH